MTYNFDSKKFIKKTYFEDLHSSYILPWNCNDLSAKKQNYYYTHRYKAVFGFEFCYNMRGAKFPEFENEGLAGVGFFSSYGDTSWLVYEAVDARVNFGQSIRYALPYAYRENGISCYHYNGIYYNRYNSIADQVNNLSPHFVDNAFDSIVNYDRGEQSYIEQTYWQHLTPAHWSNLFMSRKIPRALAIKPCARTDTFLDHFGKRTRHWTTIVNFFSNAAALSTSDNLSIYKSIASRAKRFLFSYRYLNKYRTRCARLYKGFKKAKIFKGDYAKSLGFAIGAYFSTRTPKKKNRQYLLKKLRTRIPNSLRAFKLFNALKALQTRRVRKSCLKRRNWLFHKFRIDKLVKSKILRSDQFLYTPRSDYSKLSDLCFKKSLMYRSPRYSKKRRFNTRLWYLDHGGSYYRNPVAARRAIRYKKGYKKRKFIFVF